MALAVRDRLGHYEVVGALGAGGMGEVYRARDLKLGHEVALKRRAPESPSRLNAQLPSELERVILKALEKERDLRSRRRGTWRPTWRD